MMRWMYDLWYRHGDPPWTTGPRQHLVDLVESGRLTPGRAIDLGCGIGDNAIFLATHGFDVTAVDFAPAAIERAEKKAEEAGAHVRFEVDDITDLAGEYGTFDVLVDYGTLDDLGPRDRARYLDQVVPLTRPGTQFLLYCFEWPLSRLERVVRALIPFANVAFEPGDVGRMFGDAFDIERVDGAVDGTGWPKGWAVYLMKRTNDATERETNGTF